MKKVFCSLVLFLTILLVSFSQDTINVNQKNYIKIKDKWYAINEKSGAKYLVNEKYISIKFKQENVSIDSGLKLLKTEGLNLKVMRRSKAGWLDIEVPVGTNVFDLVSSLTKIKIIKEVQINSFGTLDFTPNDDHYYQQWHLFKIHANSAWDNYAGSNSNVVIAILDCGTDWTHEDLGMGSDNYQNIWLNTGEDAWTTANNPSTGDDVDNDGNGIVDDWKGWDFIDNDNDSRSPDLSHGTLVAGIAAAKTNNDRGVAGIAGGSNNNGVKLMILRVAYSYYGIGVVDFGVVDDAIDYAVAKGAKVINMSFGGNYNQAIEESIDSAYHNHGVVFVASTGNYPPGTSAVRFPANADHVIAVGSTDANDSKSDFSCYGSETDISAPGEDIYTTTINNGYTDEDVNGTSFAAPQVSATVALLLSINPNLTPDQIRYILISTADKVGGYNYNWDQNHPGQSVELGYGRLNVSDALHEVLQNISGSNNVCSYNAEYSISNLPSGATISWNCSGNITQVSTPGSNPGEFVTNENGDGWIGATISYNGIYYNLPTKYVWSGNPIAPTNIFSMQYPPCLPGSTDFYFNEPGNSFLTGYHWYLQSEYYSALYTYGMMASVLVQIPQYITLSVNAENQCGFSDTYYTDPIYLDYCEYKMVLSPNPATDRLKIELPDNSSGIATLEITNSLGVKVVSTTITGIEKTIDISSLPKGLYYLNVFSNSKGKSKISTERFIKE